MAEPPLAFTPEQVCRITGLSRRQLAYWDNTGFFRSRFARDARRFGRMYSFQDLVGLRAIARLRDRLSLQELRRVGAWLQERYELPWGALRFYVVDGKVLFEDETKLLREARTGQIAMKIELKDIADEAHAAATKLTTRQSDQIGRVVRNRYVQHNSWVVDGTRIPTRAIWDFHLAGFDTEAIQREYPRLCAADVEAALEFERQKRSKAS
jgi:uncharacterized protein (DUF433 family)